MKHTTIIPALGYLVLLGAVGCQEESLGHSEDTPSWSFQKQTPAGDVLNVSFYLQGPNYSFSTATRLPNGDQFFDEGPLVGPDLDTFRHLTSRPFVESLKPNFDGMRPIEMEDSNNYVRLDLSFPECLPKQDQPAPDCPYRLSGLLYPEPANPSANELNQFIHDFGARHRGEKGTPFDYPKDAFQPASND